MMNVEMSLTKGLDEYNIPLHDNGYINIYLKKSK